MTVIVTQSRLASSGNQHDIFREFVSAFTNMFTQSGWVNTEASGTINPTTVSASNVTNAVMGYQVWRFNDTLHNSGFPVYVKMEWGSPTSAAYSGFWLSAGFWHNGSGSICPSGVNGIGCTPRIALFSAGSGNTLYTHRVCCISGSDLVGLVNENSAPFVVERTKDMNGQSTNEGIVVHIANGLTNNWYYNSTHLLYSYNTASYTPPTETVSNYILSTGHAVANNNLTLGFLIPVVSSSFGYPSRMVGIITANSLTINASHTLNLFGTQSVYYVPNYSIPANQRNRRDTSPASYWIVRSE